METTIVIYTLIGVSAILFIWAILLIEGRHRAINRISERIKARYQKEISDQAYEINRLNYLYKQFVEESQQAKQIVEDDTDHSGLPTQESLFLERKKLEAEKEDMATRNRKLWDMSIQIQKDKQKIQILKNKIESDYKNISDSIRYAKRIQDAILPKGDILSSGLDAYFLFWRPKETVSGDFYWMKREGDILIFAIADCTGHGVPGAFMSMMGVTFLNEICSQINEDIKSSDILEQLRTLIITTLKQSDENPLEPKDGMDLALCVLNTRTLQLKFSGANNPLYLVRDCQLTEYKAVKNPIGFYPKLKPFETIEIQAQKGDYLYMFSDGFADQFNSESRKKVTYGRFKNLLTEINTKTQKPEEQKEMLNTFIDDWRGSFVQMDDILIGGYRI